MALSILAALSLLSLTAWLALAFGRGAFWRVRLDEHRAPPEDGRRGDMHGIHVEIVVPARDEAATIGVAIASLTAQRFDGTFGLTVVDDHSGDGTAGIARTAANASGSVDARPAARAFEVVPGRALRAGWTGKLNALDCGVAHVLSQRGAPDYWLFTDADIRHAPGELGALVDKATAERLDLTSLMVRLRCSSAWEKLLIPAFVFFFRMLYPFAWSNDPQKKTAAAAGGCVLLAHAALERIGGLAAISHALIDDCALAAAVKGSGGRVWLGQSDATESIRAYDDLGPIWHMVKRSAFSQLRYSYALAAGTVAVMILLYALPPLAFVAGAVTQSRIPLVAGAMTLALMAALYAPVIRAFGLPPIAAASLPAAAALYMAMTLDSAFAYLRRRGGIWKGRLDAAA